MGNIVAGAAGAVISLIAVIVGAWLNSQREHRHWLREQKMRAAIDFITAVRHLLHQYRAVGKESMDQTERREWRNRMQSARTSLYLLCTSSTIELAEELSQRLFATTPDMNTDEVEQTNKVLRGMVNRLRNELGQQLKDD